MKFKTSILLPLITALSLIGFTAVAQAAKVVQPNQGNPGSWRVIGKVQANYGGDHDTIIVEGPYDNFRAIKFKVTDAPLNMHHMLVTYDNGAPDKIEIRQNIAQGGESRVIDLKGVGKRSLRKVEFWYDTQGKFKGKADVILFGKK